MTEKEARNLTPEQWQKLPWNEPCFIMGPNRYWHTMFFMTVPRGEQHPRGGDLTGLLWRYLDKPQDWFFTHRFRYYHSADPWDGKDQKHWFAMKCKGATGEEIASKLHAWLADCAIAAGECFKARKVPDVHLWEVKGGEERLVQLHKTGNVPFWLNTKTEPAGDETPGS